MTGNAAEAGDPLVKDPRVSGISFTGSTAAGRQIAEYCGKTLKRLGLGVAIVDGPGRVLSRARELLPVAILINLGARSLDSDRSGPRTHQCSKPITA